MLNIKVETIHGVGLEGTRIDIGVVLVLGTERVPQEIGKPDGLNVTGQLLVGSFTSNRQQNGLAHLLADRDILPNLVATAEKLRSRVDGAITLVAKVGAGIGTDRVRIHVNKRQVNDIERRLFTEVTQALLIRALALLHPEVSKWKTVRWK